MNKAELLANVTERETCKFVATLVPAMMWLWFPDPKSSKPYHAQIAVKLGLAIPLEKREDSAQLLDEGNFRAGYLRIKKGEAIILYDKSIGFRKNYPTETEFATLCEGEMVIMETLSSTPPDTKLNQ